MEIKQPSNWLRARDVKDGEKILFIDEGELVPNQMYPTDKMGNPNMQFNIGVNYKGDNKKLTVNFGSQKFLIPAFGANTVGWIGKEATITVIPTTTGKLSILLKPVVDVTKE
jgi:hypothetical protein